MKNKKLLVLSTFSALLLVATIIGCTGTGGLLFPGGGSLFQFFAPKFAFTFNGDGTNTINTWTVNSSTGALTAASSGVSTNVSGCCQVFMAVDPTSRFLFVPNYDNGTVSTFTVNADGTISGPIGTDATAGTQPFSAAIHPSGRFLYVVNYGSDDVSTFSIAADGSLTAVGTAVAAGHLPHTAIMDWQGRFLYVTHGSYYDGDSVANDTINAFSIDSQTGALTSVGSFNAGVTPRGGMVDYSGQFLIIANRGNFNCGSCPPAADPGSIAVFQIASNGSLTAVAGSPFRDTACDTTPGNECGPFNPAEIIVNGTAYVIASNLDGETLSVFSMDSTGRLTPASGSPFDLGGIFSWAHYAAVDTSGLFAYVSDYSNDEITPITFGASGTPTAGTAFTDTNLFEPTQLIFSH